MLDPKGTFDELVARYASSPEQAEGILANRIYRNLTGALSGTQEYMAMEKLYELSEEGGFDLVVVDTPPSRNALDFLDAPRRLTRFLEPPPLPAAADADPGLAAGGVGGHPGPAPHDLEGGRGRDRPRRGGVLPGLRGHGGGVPDPGRARCAGCWPGRTTAFVLVTSPRSDTVEEAGWFADKLTESGLAVEGLVVNRVHPAFAARRARCPSLPPGSALAALDRRTSSGYQAVNRREEEAFAALVTRWLRPRCAGPAARRRTSTTWTASASWPTTSFPTSSATVSLTAVRTIVVASDAPSVRADVVAVVGDPGDRDHRGRLGPQPSPLPSTSTSPTSSIVDLQMGNMGGMAVCLELRLEESYGNLPHVPVLMLLDRRPDVFLARRSGAEGWIVKPLDPIRLRKADDGAARTGAPTTTSPTSRCPSWSRSVPSGTCRRAAARSHESVLRHLDVIPTRATGASPDDRPPGSGPSDGSAERGGDRADDQEQLILAAPRTTCATRRCAR